MLRIVGKPEMLLILLTLSWGLGTAHDNIQCAHLQEGTCQDDYEQTADKDPFWEEWSTWSDCSVTCGTGVMVRSRTCLVLDVGLTCEGPNHMEEPCILMSCPNDKSDKPHVDEDEFETRGKEEPRNTEDNAQDNAQDNGQENVNGNADQDNNDDFECLDNADDAHDNTVNNDDVCDGDGNHEEHTEGVHDNDEFDQNANDETYQEQAEKTNKMESKPDHQDNNGADDNEQADEADDIEADDPVDADDDIGADDNVDDGDDHIKGDDPKTPNEENQNERQEDQEDRRDGEGDFDDEEEAKKDKTRHASTASDGGDKKEEGEDNNGSADDDPGGESGNEEDDEGDDDDDDDKSGAKKKRKKPRPEDEEEEEEEDKDEEEEKKKKKKKRKKKKKKRKKKKEADVGLDDTLVGEENIASLQNPNSCAVSDIAGPCITSRSGSSQDNPSICTDTPDSMQITDSVGSRDTETSSKSKRTPSSVTSWDSSVVSSFTSNMSETGSGLSEDTSSSSYWSTGDESDTSEDYTTSSDSEDDDCSYSISDSVFGSEPPSPMSYPPSADSHRASPVTCPGFPLPAFVPKTPSVGHPLISSTPLPQSSTEPVAHPNTLPVIPATVISSQSRDSTSFPVAATVGESLVADTSRKSPQEQNTSSRQRTANSKTDRYGIPFVPQCNESSGIVDLGPDDRAVK